MERKVSVNRRDMHQVCTRQATVMTKRNARQRAILYRISCTRTFHTQPSRNTFTKTLMKSVTQRGRLSLRSSTAPLCLYSLWLVKNTNCHFDAASSALFSAHESLRCNGKKNVYVYIVLHQRPMLLHRFQDVATKRQTIVRQFTCYRRHAPIKDDTDLTSCQTTYWYYGLWMNVYYLRQINFDLFRE